MTAARILRICAILCAVLLGVLQAAPAAALDARAVIEELASYGDRSVGSEGNEKAADYVAEAFERLVPPEPFAGLGEEGDGRIVDRQPFRIPVRKHHGSTITIQGSGQSAELHPLIMNAVAPGTLPPGEPPRRVVYVGPGELKDFNGAEIKDAVVLMDLDSGKNWMNAALLGARALIYLDDPAITESAPRWFFEDKLELTPIDFPRFWMPKAEAESLFGPMDDLQKGDLGLQADLSNDIAWKDATAENIYCFIPGSEERYRDQLVIFEAFYDSTGYVPSASPGADEAVSIAELLNLAEHFGNNPPKRNVLLLATSGHSQAQAGMREFIMALDLRGRYARSYQMDLRDRAKNAAAAVKALERSDPLSTLDEEAEEFAREAINQVIKTRVDAISTRLMRLRL
ncbi:MAG: M28 family peptidase, partial [Oceanidesulfovibrio sp.]